MKSLLKPFEVQYMSFIDEISKRKHVRIGTLGPSGTSSEQAAKFIIAYLIKKNAMVQYEIELRNDFEKVFEGLDKNEVDYVVIPTAYEKISDFFWCYKFSNVLNFIYRTPDYGLICRENFNHSNHDEFVIAACPAVHGIIQSLRRNVLCGKGVKILTTRSTTESAIFVLEGKADLGITNETSFAIYKDRGIKFISEKYNAHIIWSVFKNKLKLRE